MANVLACLLTRSSVTPTHRFQYPAFAFEVDSDTAVDAFYHPYAYAALFGIYFKPVPAPLPTASSTLETGLRAENGPR